MKLERWEEERIRELGKWQEMLAYRQTVAAASRLEKIPAWRQDDMIREKFGLPVKGINGKSVNGGAVRECFADMLSRLPQSSKDDLPYVIEYLSSKTDPQKGLVPEAEGPEVSRRLAGCPSRIAWSLRRLAVSDKALRRELFVSYARQLGNRAPEAGEDDNEPLFDHFDMIQREMEKAANGEGMEEIEELDGGDHSYADVEAPGDEEDSE